MMHWVESGRPVATSNSIRIPAFASVCACALVKNILKYCLPEICKSVLRHRQLGKRDVCILVEF